MKPVEAEVVHAVLPVHQDRHVVRARQLVEPLHLGRVTVDAELLLTDHDAASFQVAFDLGEGVVEVRDVVGAGEVLAPVSSREHVARLVAERLCLQTVGQALVCGRTVGGPASRQQDRRRDAEHALVREEHVVGTAAVPEMLVDVDDWLGCWSRRLPRTRERQPEQRQARAAEELTP
jgi:hypothetical protein